MIVRLLRCVAIGFLVVSLTMASTLNGTETSAVPAPKWLKGLSPAAQRAWLESKNRLDINNPAMLGAVMKLSPEEQVEFIRRMDRYAEDKDFEARARAEDRAELVRPAPPGFSPDDTGRKVKLTLIPRSTILRRGDSFWYRLELQNVGRETIHVLDQDISSFWKWGDVGFPKYRFFVTLPGGTEVKARIIVSRCNSQREMPLPGWGEMSESERSQTKARLQWMLRSERARWHLLDVDLRTGETLVTRPWRYLDNSECAALEAQGFPGIQVPGEFRELAMAPRLNKPGTYRIRVVLNDPPPDEKEIQRRLKFGIGGQPQIEFYKRWREESLGVVESNTASFEVLR